MNEIMFKPSKIIKYDVLACFIFVLLLSFFMSFKVALVFSIGLFVSVVNFYISQMIMKYYSDGGEKWILFASYIIRIIIVAALALPFSKTLIQLIAYLGGYLVHLAIMVIYGIKNIERK